MKKNEILQLCRNGIRSTYLSVAELCIITYNFMVLLEKPIFARLTHRTKATNLDLFGGTPSVVTLQGHPNLEN